jgi:dTDP-4-dehydrorhamnose reductase
MPVASRPSLRRRGPPPGMTRPTILVTGANGQVGAELVPLLRSLGTVVGTDHSTLDICDAGAVASALRELRPSIVVNAAAYTAVDRAESEREQAFAVNAIGPGVLAQAAKQTDALLVHYSTDYVFDGRSQVPYAEDAPTSPLSVYGASKLEGEQRIAASGVQALVFRTSWVYGLRGANFLTTIRRLAAQGDELRIVDDQIGVPNWSRLIARATLRVLELGREALADRAGLYHLSCGGETTWYRFAEAFLRDTPGVRVLPIGTTDYPTPARRPAYGVLDTAKLQRTFGFSMPAWRAALDECLASPPEPV